MEQIIKAISEKLNLPEGVVRSGAGILLNFIKQKAAGSQFEALLNFLPGASGLMASAVSPGASAGGGSLLGGILGKAGSLLGGQTGEAAAVVGALSEAGVSPDKAAPFASELFEQIKGVAGPDLVNDLVSNIPAIKSLLGDKA